MQLSIGCCQQSRHCDWSPHRRLTIKSTCSMVDFSLASHYVLAETRARLLVSLKRTAPAVLGLFASLCLGTRQLTRLDGVLSLSSRGRDLALSLGWADVLRRDDRHSYSSRNVHLYVKASSSSSPNICFMVRSFTFALLFNVV
jgi:hypothetical protein